MNNPKLSLRIMSNRVAVCRLDKNSQIPLWATSDSFFSISKTDNEISIVCSENKVPKDIKSEKNWRVIKVKGPLEFSLTGVLSYLASPLAKAKISIFAISTYDTDYILVKNDKLEKAVEILSKFCDIEET